MAKCELNVVLDRPNATYAAFEPITGRVEVSVDGDCRCDGLTLTAQWFTHGRGNQASGDGEKLELFKGNWTAGDTPHYTFELHGLDGPLTYHGHDLNVDWRLVARADIPWALDPKGERELILVRGDAKPDRLTQLIQPVVRSADVARAAPFVGACFGLVFALPGLGVAIGGVVGLAAGELGAVMMIPFGLIFMAVGGLITFMVLRNSIAARRLGEVDLGVAPSTLQAGQVVRVHLGFRPPKDVTINSIKATLVGKEEVVRGSGTNKSTYRHELFREETTLMEQKRLHRLEDVALDAALTLPADAPPSFNAPSNALVWSVNVHIDVEGWPDWSLEEPLVVLPA